MEVTYSIRVCANGIPSIELTTHGLYIPYYTTTLNFILNKKLSNILLFLTILIKFSIVQFSFIDISIIKKKLINYAVEFYNHWFLTQILMISSQKRTIRLLCLKLSRSGWKGCIIWITLWKIIRFCSRTKSVAHQV